MINLRELFDNKLVLLPLLESMCSVDETVVRNEAVKSLASISKTLSESDMAGQFAPMVIRLAQGEWFTSRVSACSLFYFAYPNSGSQKDKLRKYYYAFFLL